jgi:sugar O-acyltransferase (sialic acid O-acetyltransferase NeuD family)
MKTSRVVIIGVGGHARVIADALLSPELRTKGFELAGFLDDNPDLLNKIVLGKPVLGKIANLEHVPHDAVVVGIGDNEIRCRLFNLLASRGEKFATIIHPSAIISASVKVGVGTVVFARVVVNALATIGDNVILNTGCTVGHDCVIASHSHVDSGAHLGGTVHVGEGAWIGVGSTIIHKRKIGEWTTLETKTVVVKDVTAHSTIWGVPGRER